MAEDDKTDTDCWMFWCPVHGLENIVFCFRAADPKYKDKWLCHKLVDAETSDEERDKQFNSFVERMKNTPSIFGRG